MYDGSTEIVDAAIKLVDSLPDRCVVVADRPAARTLEGRLDDSIGVVDVDETAFHPARTVQRLLARLAAQQSRGNEACIISTVTPSVASGWDAWLLYEVMLNLIARDHIELHCLVQRSAVPHGVADPMSAAHPLLATGDSFRANPGYLTPRDQIAGLNPWPVPDYPPHIVLLDPDASSPRHKLAELAADRLEPGALERFQVAVSEIVTNAIRHGRRPIAVSIWASEDGITTSVRDAGTGLRDPLVGLLPPEPAQIGGHGMWIARSWSDWLHVISTPTGCEVRLGLDSRSRAA